MEGAVVVQAAAPAIMALEDQGKALGS